MCSIVGPYFNRNYIGIDSQNKRKYYGPIDEHKPIIARLFLKEARINNKIEYNLLKVSAYEF